MHNTSGHGFGLTTSRAEFHFLSMRKSFRDFGRGDLDLALPLLPSSSTMMAPFADVHPTFIAAECHLSRCWFAQQSDYRREIRHILWLAHEAFLRTSGKRCCQSISEAHPGDVCDFASSNPNGKSTHGVADSKCVPQEILIHRSGYR